MPIGKPTNFTEEYSFLASFDTCSVWPSGWTPHSKKPAQAEWLLQFKWDLGSQVPHHSYPICLFHGCWLSSSYRHLSFRFLVCTTENKYPCSQFVKFLPIIRIPLQRYPFFHEVLPASPARVHSFLDPTTCPYFYDIYSIVGFFLTSVYVHLTPKSACCHLSNLYSLKVSHVSVNKLTKCWGYSNDSDRYGTFLQGPYRPFFLTHSRCSKDVYWGKKTIWKFFECIHTNSHLTFGIDNGYWYTLCTIDAYYVPMTWLDRLDWIEQLNPGVKELLFSLENLYWFGVSPGPYLFKWLCKVLTTVLRLSRMSLKKSFRKPYW